MAARPTTSNADEWNLWLQDHADSAPAYIAVQIVEAIEEHQKALAREVYGLREQTEAECEGVTEGKQGAYARGRMHEAKSIARAISAIMPYSRDPGALAHGGRERLAGWRSHPSVFLQMQPDGKITSRVHVPDGMSPAAAMDAMKRLHAHLGEEIARAATDCPAQRKTISFWCQDHGEFADRPGATAPCPTCRCTCPEHRT